MTKEADTLTDPTPSTPEELKTDAPQGNMFETMNQFRAEKRGEAVAELPQQQTAEPAAETPPAEPAPPAEPSENIKIGDKVFTDKQQAFDYAGELEREALVSQAHQQGVREALEATKQQQVPAEPEGDDWETQFYQNPKQAIEQVKEDAKKEALAIIQQENAKERAWSEFSNDYPDLADYRPEVERTLRDNWGIYGKMQDDVKAKKLLAGQVRGYFDKIAEARLPRKELPNSGTQPVIGAGNPPPRGVTPKEKKEAPLTLVEQMKIMRRTRK